MSVIESINNHSQWLDFLLYKKNNDSLTNSEEKALKEFIEGRRYEYYYSMIKKNKFPADFPHKMTVNKEGTDKKRIVYSFDGEENMVFKFIAFNLYRFDEMFRKSCYSFRRGYGVKDAIGRFKGNKSFASKYCFKADISNYFNSVDVELLIGKMSFVKDRDIELFNLFEKILREDRVYDNGDIITENHGAMAGMPCSPFFANVYLADVDKFFEERKVPYFRYSDDILMFADTEAELNELMERFHEKIRENRLTINTSKVTITKPFEPFEFLGFSYDNGTIDLSANTMRKLKAKIKRKSDALRRWQRSKGLTSDKAAIGFINAMNRKFYGGSSMEWNEDDFTWCRWFFPNITTDKSLKEIDEYMQEYIRYIVTGRHYKGNYRITYEQLKSWGYKSLVHEYYRWKKR